MKRILSLLLCVALLLPCALSCAESAAFDGSVFAGKKGYTLREDGSWTCVRGAEFPYPGFVIAVRISVSGKGDGTVEAPQLEVGLLKSSGSDEAAMDVTGAAFYMGSKAYAYHLYLDCQHLKKCREEGHVKKIALEELNKNDGKSPQRTLCKTCEKRYHKNH